MAEIHPSLRGTTQRDVCEQKARGFISDVGAIGGTAIGAAIGSFVPGVGTFMGATTGAVAGVGSAYVVGHMAAPYMCSDVPDTPLGNLTPPDIPKIPPSYRVEPNPFRDV